MDRLVLIAFSGAIIFATGCTSGDAGRSPVITNQHLSMEGQFMAFNRSGVIDSSDGVQPFVANASYRDGVPDRHDRRPNDPSRY